MSGAILLGFLTDQLPFGRRKRALCTCGIVLVINCIIWGAGLGFQVQFDRASIEADSVLLGAATPWDFNQSSSAGGPISLLMFCMSYFTFSSQRMSESSEANLSRRLPRRCRLPGSGLLHHEFSDQR